jgi:hypothetical protein
MNTAMLLRQASNAGCSSSQAFAAAPARRGGAAPAHRGRGGAPQGSGTAAAAVSLSQFRGALAVRTHYYPAAPRSRSRARMRAPPARAAPAR